MIGSLLLSIKVQTIKMTSDVTGALFQQKIAPIPLYFSHVIVENKSTTVFMVYRVFSHDVTAAILVSQNKEMAAMLVSQTKPLGIELYFCVNTFFCFSKPIWPVVT